MTDKQPELNQDETDQVAAWADIGSSRKSINMAITETLRQAILSGKFKSGDRLTEVGLAKAFDVSRNPVREALRVLEVEGLVEISPRKGARVAVLSGEEVQEIIELRAELEGMSARYAAGRCSDEVRANLRKLLVEGNRADATRDVAVLTELNNSFHNQIAVAGKNRFLVGFMKALNEKTQWIFANRPEHNIAENWKEHAAILEAVIAADAELASVLAKRHVEDIGKEITRANEEKER
jgi:DNA-binding GntR family transcriptional regulator